MAADADPDAVLASTAACHVVASGLVMKPWMEAVSAWRAASKVLACVLTLGGKEIRERPAWNV